MPRILAVIPARYASTRFPGKPLASATGKPLIQHVVERVRLAKSVERIIVATDDQRILDVVQAFGTEAVMTRQDHPNGTCRIAEVVQNLPPDEFQIIVNVQGDEPELEPRVVDELVKILLADPDAPMATVASAFTDKEDPSIPDITKVVVDRHGRALYFSRCRIPYDRDGIGQANGRGLLKHLGLYAYRPQFLLKYVTLVATPLEQMEQLEQLRALEHGYPIAVAQTRVSHHGVDTPRQYEEFVQRYTGQP